MQNSFLKLFCIDTLIGNQTLTSCDTRFCAPSRQIPKQLVPEEGVEPSRLATLDFESSMTTNSITPASIVYESTFGDWGVERGYHYATPAIGLNYNTPKIVFKDILSFILFN